MVSCTHWNPFDAIGLTFIVEIIIIIINNSAIVGALSSCTEWMWNEIDCQIWCIHFDIKNANNCNSKCPNSTVILVSSSWKEVICYVVSRFPTGTKFWSVCCELNLPIPKYSNLLPAEQKSNQIFLGYARVNFHLNHTFFSQSLVSS